jgi:hypothetical protein
MKAKDLIRLVEEQDYASMTDPGPAIKKDYKVDSHGVIRSPGKFEGEMYYVPYYWDIGMNGLADEDDGTNWLFNLDTEDYKRFPELKGSKTLILYSSEQGFAYAELDAEMPEPEDDEETEEQLEQRMGRSRTDAERKARHKRKFGTTELPPRGTGRRMGHSGRDENLKDDLEGVLQKTKDKLNKVDSLAISNQGKKWMKQTYRKDIQRLQKRIKELT